MLRSSQRHHPQTTWREAHPAGRSPLRCETLARCLPLTGGRRSTRGQLRSMQTENWPFGSRSRPPRDRVPCSCLFAAAAPLAAGARAGPWLPAKRSSHFRKEFHPRFAMTLLQWRPGCTLRQSARPWTPPCCRQGAGPASAGASRSLHLNLPGCAHRALAPAGQRDTTRHTSHRQFHPRHLHLSHPHRRRHRSIQIRATAEAHRPH